MNIELAKSSDTDLSLTQLIKLRSDFEDLTNGFSMPAGSDINNIKWFLKNGYRSNSLRDGFKEAKEIAKKIKEYADGCTKETRKGKSIRSPRY